MRDTAYTIDFRKLTSKTDCTEESQCNLPFVRRADKELRPPNSRVICRLNIVIPEQEEIIYVVGPSSVVLARFTLEGAKLYVCDIAEKETTLFILTHGCCFKAEVKDVDQLLIKKLEDADARKLRISSVLFELENIHSKEDAKKKARFVRYLLIQVTKDYPQAILIEKKKISEVITKKIDFLTSCYNTGSINSLDGLLWQFEEDGLL